MFRLSQFPYNSSLVFDRRNSVFSSIQSLFVNVLTQRATTNYNSNDDDDDDDNWPLPIMSIKECKLGLKCDGTRAETRFRLSAKRTSPFKPAGASVQSTTGSRGVRISGSNESNAGYTMFQESVKSTGYLFHSPVSSSLPLHCVPSHFNWTLRLYDVSESCCISLPPTTKETYSLGQV
jgi:hypothetical protein